MATFVLVHGAGHGSWCWNDVAPLLRGQGHIVLAPTLEGVGERLHEATSLTGLYRHADEIAGIVRNCEAQKVVLVGHSYGGMVVTAAAALEPDRIAMLVYLDAAIPEDGEALLDVSPGLSLLAGTTFEHAGVRMGLQPDMVAGPIYGLTDKDVLDRAMPLLTPHPWRCFEESLRVAHPNDLGSIPRAILNCRETLARRPQGIRHRWQNGTLVEQIDAPHDCMLTHPDQVAEFLMRCAQFGG